MKTRILLTTVSLLLGLSGLTAAELDDAGYTATTWRVVKNTETPSLSEFPSLGKVKSIKPKDGFKLLIVQICYSVPEAVRQDADFNLCNLRFAASRDATTNYLAAAVNLGVGGAGMPWNLPDEGEGITIPMNVKKIPSFDFVVAFTVPKDWKSFKIDYVRSGKKSLPVGEATISQ